MGQEFAIIYDIIIVATVVGLTFAGIKKGFARVALEMVAVFIAFALAFFISAPVSRAIYGEFIEKPLDRGLDAAIGDSGGIAMINPFGDISLDFDKAKISGAYAGEVVPNYEGTGLAVMDLSSVDLSETGIEKIDLEMFGISADTDFSKLNAKTADFTMSDINKYGLGKLTTAHYLATRAVKTDLAGLAGNIINAVREKLPMIFSAGDGDAVSVSSIRTIILAMIETRTPVKTALMDGIISPSCIIIIRSIAVTVLFIVFMIILSVVIRLAGLVNKVPVLGKLNALAGGVLGLCEAAVAVVIICLVTRLIVVMFSGNAILFNETAINSTFIFKRIYFMDMISFI